MGYRNGALGWGIYDLNGWGIYDLNEWGIYDLNRWTIYGSNRWGIYDKVSYCFLEDILQINSGLQGSTLSSPKLICGSPG